MPELVDIRDEQGQPTGEVMVRHEAHKAEAWHGVALVWLHDSKGRILLQRRAAHLNTFPELWDVSVCGHLEAGEKPMQTALRELSEELGLYIDAADIKEVPGMLADSFPLVYGKIHNECDYIFLVHQDIEADKLRLQAAEIMEVRWVSADQLEKDLTDNVAAGHYARRDRRVYQIIIDAARKRAAMTEAE